MAAKTKVIIDTDPGLDDVLAMLLAFAADPKDLEILLISLTFGNIDLQNTLRNVVSLLSIVKKEQAWREAHGKPKGFECLAHHRPLVAIGAEKPLADQLIMADYFHGKDGLGGIHTTHPHLSPSEEWKGLFSLQAAPSDVEAKPLTAEDLKQTAALHDNFIPSTVPAHKLILKILADNPPDTVTIVALGPLTNVALAASEDPETLLKAKEIAVMGANIDHPGNITPLAEFNTHADTIAFARVLALTSKYPRATMPPWPPGSNTETHLPPYPAWLSRRLKVTLAPLDITTPHLFTQRMFEGKLKTLGFGEGKHSPLSEWLVAVMAHAWKRATSPDDGLSLHDPLAVYYAYTASNPAWQVKHDEDVRVETAGQWARGACIVDRRGKPKVDSTSGIDEEHPSDQGGWKDTRKGNLVSRIIASPFWAAAGNGQDKPDEKFASALLDIVFGAGEHNT